MRHERDARGEGSSGCGTGGRQREPRVSLATGPGWAAPVVDRRTGGSLGPRMGQRGSLTTSQRVREAGCGHVPRSALLQKPRDGLIAVQAMIAASTRKCCQPDREDAGPGRKHPVAGGVFLCLGFLQEQRNRVGLRQKPQKRSSPTKAERNSGRDLTKRLSPCLPCPVFARAGRFVTQPRQIARASSFSCLPKKRNEKKGTPESRLPGRSAPCGGGMA